jgi:hypothetical protein
MRIHHRGAGDGLPRTLPTAATDGALAGEGSSGRPDALAADDAIQLSSLGGVLNRIQMGANSAATFHHIAQLVQQNQYQVDAMAISRKLIAASLQ